MRSKEVRESVVFFRGITTRLVAAGKSVNDCRLTGADHPHNGSDFFVSRECDGKVQNPFVALDLHLLQT